VSADDELREARRAVLLAPDDEIARIRLDRIEDRLGLKPPREPEARAFWTQTRGLWRAAGTTLDFEAARPLMAPIVLPVIASPPRDEPRWSWVRSTEAGWATRPIFFCVRTGDRVAVSIARAQTGPRNLVTPDMIWNSLGPWAPGAHEHTRPGQGSVEFVFSWQESEVANGVCVHCGEIMTPRLVAMQQEAHARIRTWLDSTDRKVTAHVEAVRFFFDGWRGPATPRRTPEDDED
jgi:hypothetical protein